MEMVRTLSSAVFGIITGKGNFPLCADALTTVAPAMGYFGRTTMRMMLIESRRLDLTPMQHGYIRFKRRDIQEELLLLVVYDIRSRPTRDQIQKFGPSSRCFSNNSLGTG